MSDKITPVIGLHRDVPFEVYCSWDALNSSTLRWGRVTGKHLQCAANGEMENNDTPDRKLGRAAHAWILEGEESFNRLFKVAGRCKAVQSNLKVCGNAGKFVTPDGDWFCGVKGHRPQHAEEPVEVISAEEFNRVKRMQDSVRRHPINFHLKREGLSEVSAAWEAADVLCKARMDRMAPAQKGFPHLVIDLKKIQVGKGTKWDCEKAIADYGYHIQMAMYAEAVRTIEGVEDVDCVWVFIEDKPPFDVNFIPASDEVMRIGQEELDQLRSQYKQIQETGRAFGYSDSPLHIAGGDEDEDTRGGLPEWYIKRFNQWA